MASFFDRLKRILLPILAAVVIALALLVGTARLLLPQVPQYRDDIRQLAEAATGFSVEFGDISAGMSRYGPQLRLEETRISMPDEPDEFLYAEQISISLDVATLVLSQQLVPGRTEVRGVQVNLVRTPEGAVAVQGRLLSEWLRLRGGGELNLDSLPDTSLWLRDVTLVFTDEFLDRPATDFLISELKAELDDGTLLFDGSVEPEQRFGRDIGLLAEIPLAPLFDDEQSIGSAVWTIELNVPDLDIAEWAGLLPKLGSPVSGGSGSGVVSAKLRGGIPLSVGADIDLDDVEFSNGQKRYERIAGKFFFEAEAGNWRFSADDMVLQTAEHLWPESDIELQYEAGSKPDSQTIAVSASYLKLDDFAPLARGFAAEALERAGITGELSGEVSNLSLKALLVANKPEILKINAEFDKVGYSDAERGISIAGLDGQVRSNDEEGRFDFSIVDSQARLDFLFREAFQISKLNGLLVWRAKEDGFTLIGNGLRLTTPFGSGRASLELLLPFDSALSPTIDLTAAADVANVADLKPVMPKIIPPKVITWLDGALLAGRVEGATAKLKGKLREFPFEPGEPGEFIIRVPFEQGTLEYAKDWPLLEDAEGLLVFDGVSMFSVENRGLFAGTRFENLQARMDDMRTGELTLAAELETGAPQVMRFLRESTLSKALGPVLGDITASGSVSGSFDALLPIKNLGDWRFDGQLAVADGAAGLQGLDFGFSDVSGDITITNTLLRSDNLRGNLFGEPVTIVLEPPPESERNLSQLATLNSATPVAKLAEVFRLPFPERLSGEVSWEADARFPSRRYDDTSIFELVVDADLSKAAVDLPAPVSKASGAAESGLLTVSFPQPGSFELSARLDQGVNTRLRFEKEDSVWRIERGAVHMGGLPVELPQLPRVEVTGRVPALRLADWIELGDDAAPDTSGNKPWYETFREFYMFTSELNVFDFSFPDSRLRAQQINDVWIVDVEGPRANGRLSVPNEMLGERPVMLDMALLDLQPVDTGDAEVEPTDPREFPAMLARVRDLRLLDMSFGYLEAEVFRIDSGLQTRRVFSQSNDFNVTLEGDWRVTGDTVAEQRSRLKFDLRSSNVAGTLESLGYDPLIVAEQGSAKGDLTWNGPPGLGLLYESKGSFGFRIEEGQVMNVDPGGGRLLGLMSITSLPRRLSLDFRDVFDEGLGFDKLKGNFSLQDGIAHTCNVSLEGSVTDMALIGSSDLSGRTYNQLAVIRPHMSNVLPLGTAVVAGPAIGAAVLLVAAVFKEPLSNIGANYYEISDSWDDPVLEKVERESIDTAVFQDCEANLPEFSEEDLAALQELKERAADKTPVVMPEITAEPAAKPEDDPLDDLD